MLWPPAVPPPPPQPPPVSLALPNPVRARAPHSTMARARAQPEPPAPSNHEKEGDDDDGRRRFAAPPLSLPRGWRAPERSLRQVQGAAGAFDASHATRSSDAHAKLSRLEADATSISLQRNYADALSAVRSTRLTVQPLRVGALISPRAAAIRRLALAAEERHDGRHGGPWRPPERVLPTEGGLQEQESTSKPPWLLEKSICEHRIPLPNPLPNPLPFAPRHHCVPPRTVRDNPTNPRLPIRLPARVSI